GVRAKTYIILGTSHRPLEMRFSATRKNYDTPFGMLETDQELLDELQKEFGEDLLTEEFAHKDEHTIELQTTYLKHVLGDRPAKIVPILVSSFEDLLAADATPKDDPLIN